PDRGQGRLGVPRLRRAGTANVEERHDQPSAAYSDTPRGACRESRLHDPERPECGHRQTPDAHRPPLLPGPPRSAGGRRSRPTARRGQRRRVPADDRELPVEVESLYREPERKQIEWGALEFVDVFKIYRSGPAETVALRGLDLRVEPRELVAVFGPS